MKLAFVYVRGRMERLAAVKAGLAPSEFFYGALELEERGHEVTFLEVGERAPLPIEALQRLWPRHIFPVKTNLRVLWPLWELREKLNAADRIVATAGKLAFGIEMLRVLGVVRPEVVGIQCGLLNFPHNTIRRRMTRRLLNRMRTMLFGEGELVGMTDGLGVARERVTVNPFGVDRYFWSPGDGARTGDVLAVGSDGQRDYATLVKAAAQIRAKVRIITRQPLPQPLPANVEHVQGSWKDAALDDARLRELYRSAGCVVTPVCETVQPSGQSVTLQAMACGAPVVLTRTAGLWERESLKDGENVMLVPPGDADAMAAAVNQVLEEPALAQRLGAAGLQHEGIGGFANRLEAML